MACLVIWGIITIIGGLYSIISGKGINPFRTGYQEIEGSKAKGAGIIMVIIGIVVLYFAFQQ